MEKNVGDTDRQVRIAVGAISGLISLIVLGQSLDLLGQLLPLPGIVSPVLGVLAAVLLITAYTRECPVCAAAGINTMEE